MKSIGVAIPCHEPYHRYLSELLGSIANQTVKPNKVVISCSSWLFDSRIDTNYKGLDLTILYTTQKQNPSQNRNAAASILYTDFISFFDADDIMHPQRIQFVLDTFSFTNCDGVVHNYKSVKKGETEPFEFYDTLLIGNSRVLKDPNTNGVYAEDSLHHAQITVRKDVFDKYKYNTDEFWNYWRCEDSVYVSELVLNGIDIRYVANMLSQYKV